MKLPQVEDIVTVYKGKPNSCMCGCSGTYYYAKAQREYGSKDRGYPVKDDEVDDGVVKRVLNKMAKAEAAGAKIDCLSGYIWDVTIGKTQYAIYTREKKG
jgi:hypothetical protein